jgi:hypothetical protein
MSELINPLQIENPIEKKKGKKRGRRKKGEDILITPEETINYIIKHWPYIGVKEIKNDILIGLRIQRDIKENYCVLDKFLYNNSIYYYDNRNTVLNIYGQYVGFIIERNVRSKSIYFLNNVYDDRTYEEVINNIESNIQPYTFNKLNNNIIIKPEAKKRGRKKGKRKKDDIFLIKPEDVIDYISMCWGKLEIDKIKGKIVQGIKTEKEKGKEYYVLDKFVYKENTYWVDSRNTILDNNAKFVGFFIDNINGTKKIYFLKQKNLDTRTYKEIIDNIENNT